MYVSMNSRYTVYFFYINRVILVSNCFCFMRSIIGYGLAQPSGAELCQKNHIDSIIKVTGQTRLPLVAKCGKKKAFRVALPSRSTKYLFP